MVQSVNLLLWNMFPMSAESLEALAGSATRPPRACTGLLVPLVTTLSPVMEISQRMVSVSPGRRLNWLILGSDNTRFLLVCQCNIGLLLVSYCNTGL